MNSRPAKYLILLILTFFSNTIFAETNAYLGVSTSINQWQMGFASGKDVELFGITQKSNKPDPLLYMAGLSASLLYNKTWALTYQGEVGFAKPQITLSNIDVSFNPPHTNTLSSDTNIFRTDHSIAISRVLGATGFSVFIGAKVQAFGYEQANGQFTETSVGALINAYPFTIKQNLINYGPAIGLTYTFHLHKKIFGAVQGGFIYFPGQYSGTMAVNLGNQTLNNQVDEKFYGLGFTGLVSVISPLSDRLLLQISGRTQYYYARTLEGTTILQTTTKTTTTASATMDNVQDILLGVQVAVICKLF